MSGVRSDKAVASRRLAIGFLVLGCVLPLGACSVATQGAPKRLFPLDQELQAISRELTDANGERFLSADEDFRNRVVAARMYAVDLEYTEFENALLRERQRVGFWATTTSLGLNGAIPLTSSTWNKNILGGAAAFVTGTQAAYNREILLATTIQIVINQMRATRDQVKAKILKKRDQSISQYPLGDALADAEEYHRAGTLASGLVELTETVGAKSQAAQENKNLAEVQVFTLARDTSAKLLREYLYPNNVFSETRAEELNKLLAARNVTVPLWEIITNAAYLSQRDQLARDAKLLN